MHPPRVLAAAAVLGLVTVAPAATAHAGSGPVDRQAAYSAAAAEYGVPASVLLGVSYLESRWDANAGQPSMAGGFGPMHLTDFRYVSSLPGFEGDSADDADARGDDARPAPPVGPVAAPGAPADPAALQTIDRAAELTGVPVETLRLDPAANIRGGAALLADYQRSSGAPLIADPAAWYAAVAKYSGASDAGTAQDFADQVYATIVTGAARTVDDGARVSLDAQPSLVPDRSLLGALHLPWLPRPDGIECPVGLSCEWVPAPYQQLSANPGDYGNHDLSDRPHNQKIEYIVIHDTEATYATTLQLVQDPTYVSWHYTIRSADGHVAQHVKTKDVAWQAGNWYVNAKSVGIEHEGFLAAGSWYTEAMYRSSARLVRYLALRLDIPLDRQHILGHDNVPGPTPSSVRGMHTDPGPYWDWRHYFDLLGAPLHGLGNAHTGEVMVLPDYDTNRVPFTGCDAANPSAPCPSHGSTSIMLYSAPSFSAPLVRDVGKHPPTGTATWDVYDHSARAASGQVYAVAGRQGDWTAIWYLGQQAWFYNPDTAPTAEWAVGFVVTPKAGRASIPVYGRAYPEAAAYPVGVPVQSIIPLSQYTFAAGQRYAVGAVLPGEYYRAVTFDGSRPGDWTVISGSMRYVQVQFGHRVMFVNVDDVDILPSVLDAP
jgi:N-acetylmuramoyl-L-alanine amidase-like protein